MPNAPRPPLSMTSAVVCAHSCADAWHWSLIVYIPGTGSGFVVMAKEERSLDAGNGLYGTAGFWSHYYSRGGHGTTTERTERPCIQVIPGADGECEALYATELDHGVSEFSDGAGVYLESANSPLNWLGLGIDGGQPQRGAIHRAKTRHWPEIGPPSPCGAHRRTSHS
ncbi:hypothetical protein BC826DRAFT_325322 [Russula brevipes]|nr:hypothetical protein BC826DRAFT_325322 [Russula brevipes]